MQPNRHLNIKLSLANAHSSTEFDIAWGTELNKLKQIKLQTLKV